MRRKFEVKSGNSGVDLALCDFPDPGVPGNLNVEEASDSNLEA
jgi:hypothetical protein